jgi:uncharacterized membrane protein required for colicin V production
MNWLVIACGAVLLGCVIWGWCKGFIKMMIHLLAVALALALAAMLCQPLAKMVCKQESVMSSVKESVRDTLRLDKLADKTKLTNEDIEKLKLPEVIKEQLKDYNSESGFELFDAENAADYVAGVVANIIIRAACFVILFFALLAIIYLIGLGLNLVSKLPVLNTVNRLTGAIVGLFIGAVLILMFFTAVTALQNTGFGETCQTAIEENKVLDTMYNNNIICDVYFDLAGKIR